MSRLSLACLLALLCLAQLSPLAAAPPVAAPDTPAVAVVRQYLEARAAAKAEAAYALLSPGTQKMLPLSQEPNLLKQATTLADQTPSALLPIIALFVDFHDTLHFKFRVLGASGDDPAVVLVRAYQVGTPLSSIKTLKIATMADPAAGGARRIDGEKTAAFVAPQAVGNAQQAVSQSNLKQIALGIIQYVQDHNETMPDAANWIDEIMPYVKSEAVFHDPSAPDSEKWSYAYNSTLSHKSLALFDAPAETVMLFESAKGAKNASDAGDSVPVPGRHHGGADYALADGHVKWFPDNTKLSYQLSGK